MSTAAGIDIGAEAIKGVTLKANKTGPIEVIAAGTMPIADLTRMPDTPDRALAIGEKLRELVKSARLKAESRRMGASGGKTSIRYLQIPPVPPWRLEMLVKYEVEERAEEKEQNCADYHIMDVPETNGQYTVIIGMCRESFATELLQQAKTGGLGEVEIDLEAAALFASYYHGHGFDSDKTVAVVDIGAEDLTILISKNGSLYYARTLLSGGRRFTQNLADDLKIDWNEADELKKTSAEIVFDVAPAAASSTGRPRLQRPGGTMAVARPGLTAKPGASTVVPGVGAPESAAPVAGVPARSGVNPAAIAGTSEEARRARMADAAKLVARPAGTGPGSSQTRPGAPGAPAGASGAKPVVGAQPAGQAAAQTGSPSGQSGSAPAPAAAPANPAQTQKLPAPTIKLSGELDFALLDLDSDLSVPAKPAAAAAPAQPVAPVAPVAPVLPVQSAPPVVPVAPVTPRAAAPKAPPAAAASAGPAASLDEFELQPIEDEKAAGPVSGNTAKEASPAATQFVPPPAPDATQYVAAPDLAPAMTPGAARKPVAPPPSSTDALDLDLTQSSDVVGPANAAAGVAPSGAVQEPLEMPQSGAPLTAEEKDRRKRQVTAALVREAASLCAAVENVLMNCKQQAKLPNMKLDRLYITGGGSKLKGLSEFMGRRLRVEVAPLEPLKNLSLARLNPQAADALRAEQHTLGVALGLALSDLRPGALSFQLLPKVLKDRKAFWARGAYHFYAAGAAALATGLLVYTPYKNTDALNENFTIADEAFRTAKTKNDEVRKLQKENDELRHRLKTISDNIQSGDYFLNLLAELKSKNRIQDDIYLTSVSTTIPYVVIAEADTKIDFKVDTSKEPDTFQAQRRVYLRGFARGKEASKLIQPIVDFYDKLVPVPGDPDDPRNLFKDIRPIWYSKGENEKDGMFLKEFVLEAYTAAPAKETVAKLEDKNNKGKKGGKKTMGPATPATPAPAPPAAPTQPTAPVDAVPQVVNPVPAQQPVQQAVVPVQNMNPPARVMQLNPAVPAQVAPQGQPPANFVPPPVQPNPAVKAAPTQVGPANAAVEIPRRKPAYVIPDDAPPPPKPKQ